MTKGAIKLSLRAHRVQIEHCQETIEILNKEIEKIKAECPHDEGWEESMQYWAPGHATLGKFCLICGKFVADEIPSYTITTN